MSRWFVFVGCFGLSLATWGCGSKPAYQGEPRVPLTGRVTLDGTPVDGGTIAFVPLAPGQRVSGGPIVQGQYTIAENQGPNLGNYRVEIRWPKPNGKKFRDPDTGEMKDAVKESMPRKFHTGSELTATVTPEQTDFHFDLKTK